MLFDHKISINTSANPYELHCLVEELFKTDKGRNLFCDYGDHVRVRSSHKILNNKEGKKVIIPDAGTISYIELKASCYVSGGGKKYFIKQGDWRKRHSWLEKKGAASGFSVLTVTSTSQLMKIPKPGASFTLDCTDFAACIKVEDTAKFEGALRDGIGSKGRAFGFGMLIL